MPRLISIETHSGQPIRAGQNTITPFSWALRLHIPGLKGGLIWNRPTSVLIQSADGHEQVLSITDVTRMVEWSLFFSSLASVLLLGFIFRILQYRNRRPDNV